MSVLSKSNLCRMVLSLCVSVVVVMAAASASAQNLVVNGSFEDAIGSEWTFYGTTDFDQFTGYFSVTAQDGDWMVASAIDGGTKNGGVYQQISVTPGSSYVFTGWVYAWKRDAEAQDPGGRLGVDLDGGTDAEAETVMWSSTVYTFATWQQLAVAFTATGDTVTIFMDMVQRAPTFNVTALDNAVVEEADFGTIAGFVYDADTNALEGATVTAIPFAITDTTDATGAYALALPEGTYDVTASLAAYTDATASGLIVNVGGVTNQDFYLEQETCDGLVFGNGGFETGGAAPWVPYGWGGGVQTVGWFGGVAPRSGDRFYGWAINSGGGQDGGLYQQVCATQGADVELRAWSNLYWILGTESNTMSRIGIDPYGGTSAASPDVVWSDWDVQPIEAAPGWRELVVTATPVTPTITLFLEVMNDNVGGSQWHIHAFDDVAYRELLPDSDEDGMDDQWEIDHGLNPFSKEGDDGADGDPDKDTSKNIDEYRMRTHPNLWSSAFRVIDVRSENSVTLEWFAGITGPFRVFRGTDPGLSDELAVVVGLNALSHTDDGAGESRYYRVTLDADFPAIGASIADTQQIVRPGDFVTLDASASSGDVFAWTQGLGTEVVLTGADTTVATFTAPAITSSVERLTFTLSVNDGAATADAEVFVISPVVGSTVLYERDYETESTGIAGDYVTRPADRSVTVLADGSGRSTNAARLDIGAIRKHGGAIDTGANGQAAMIAALNAAGAVGGYVLTGDVLFDPPGGDLADRTGIWGMADPDASAIALLLRGQGGPRMTLRLAQYSLTADAGAGENTIVTKDPLGPDYGSFSEWYRLELILLRVPGTDTVVCEGRAWNVDSGSRPADPDVSGVVTLPGGQDEYLVGIYGYEDPGDGGWVDDFSVVNLE